MNWFGSSISSDPFGKQLLGAGILEESIMKWSLDPQVILPGNGNGKEEEGSLFELVEDLNTTQCIEVLVALQARERAACFPTISSLNNQRFNGQVIELEYVTLRNGNSEAKIYLHGAHVSSWKVNGNEKIFMSEQAVYNGNKALRGGIPVCWPQFSDMGPCKSQHGFARNFTWKLLPSSTSSSSSSLEGTCILRLDSDMVIEQVEKDAKSAIVQGWNLLKKEEDGSSSSSQGNGGGGGGGPFALEMKLTLGNNTLKQELYVTNTSTADNLTFTCALHTYFACSNASQVKKKKLEYALTFFFLFFSSFFFLFFFFPHAFV
jgi:D-hexose-6-phosphate mutarotase